MEIEIVKATTKKDLEEIKALQNKNLRSNLSEEEMQKYGFVTLSYSLDFLAEMTAEHHHVVAKYNGRVIGYVLLLDRSKNHLMTEGAGIFPIFHELAFKGKKMKDYRYVSVGQVCVDRDFGGQGLLTRMYRFYKECYQSYFDLAMTDVSYLNQRSLKAHLKTGFEVLLRFDEPDAGEPWDIVIWDWTSS